MPTESSPPSIALPTSLSEAEQESLSAQQITRYDWYAKGGEQQREVRGLYQRRSDQRVSTTDPDATLMRHGAGRLHLGYQTHYVVDGGKQRMILAALVTPAEVMENQPMRDLLWHVRFRWRLRPRQVTGDTKYGTLENMKAIEDAGMRAYIPLFNRDNEHGAYYGSSKFIYDAVHDVLSLSCWSTAPPFSHGVHGRESGIPGRRCYLQCVSAESTMYFQPVWPTSSSLFSR